GAAAAVLDHLVLAAALVEVELHEIVDGVGRRGVVEAPFADTQLGRIEAEVEELDAGTRDQRRRAGIARQAGKIGHEGLWETINLGVMAGKSTADLDVVAALVARLAALALG